MGVSHVEIIVEEPSTEATLRVLVPKILCGVSLEVYAFQGKNDLLDKLPDRLRGYAKWLPDDWRIILLVDRDDDNCEVLKERLENAARETGLTTRRLASGSAYQVASRIAIEELEDWYFGDWQAVLSAFPRSATTIPQKQRYRDPDSIAGGTWEALEGILQRAGYFKTGLRKIEAARTIAQYMDPDRNCSRSFRNFRDVLREMVSTS